MTLLARSTLLLVAAGALASAGATDCGQIIDDPGFDLWCGDALCAWQLEQGEVRRAPTWHADDPGVELVGDAVAISQLTQVEARDGHCVLFEMVADVEPAAEVHLELDVWGDGSYEHQERVPTSDWRRVSFLLRLPDRYQGVRFRLRKQGAGRAVLADLGASIAPEASCAGPAIDAGPAPLGADCDADEQCASGRCPTGPWQPNQCVACVVDADCGAGQVCGRTGIVNGPLDTPWQCFGAGTLPIGVACLDDNECASGACREGSCSGCGESACGDRGCIAVVFPSTPLTWPGPTVCGPGGGPGAPCLRGSECASGVCAGAPLRLCEGSARECGTGADCPLDASCVTVGTRGGSCQ